MKTINIPKGLSFKIDQPALSVTTLPSPSSVIYPMANRWGWLYPNVKEGDNVATGQVIAASSLPNIPNLRTSFSGTVKRIFKLPSLQLKDAQAIEIEVTKEEKEVVSPSRIDDSSDNVTIFQALLEAGICETDDYTLALPLRVTSPNTINEFIEKTHDRDLADLLNNIPHREKNIKTLIINGIDRQPNVWVRNYLITSETERLASAAKLIKKLSGAEQIILAVSQAVASNKAVKEFADALNVDIAVSNGKYPVSLEPLLVYGITGKELLFPSKNTRELELAVVDVSGLYQIAQMLIEGASKAELIVQVNIPSRNEYHLVKCFAGTPVNHIINHYSIDPDKLTKVILGGDFLGYAHYDLDIPVTGEIDSVSLWEGDVFHYEHQHCIRCGFCVSVCPVKLVPAEISLYCEYKMFDEAIGKGLYQCIECGLCAYVCPSHRPMVQLMRYGKQELQLMRVAS